MLEVIDELGYVPDSAAQSLSRRRKEVIGLVCVERTSPKLQYDIEAMSLLFYDEILRGVEATIRDLGWSLMITYVNQDSGVRPAQADVAVGQGRRPADRRGDRSP